MVERTPYKSLMLVQFQLGLPNNLKGWNKEMKEYVVLEGTRDWKEEVRRFYEEEEARAFFNELVEDYRRQGSKFTKNITGATKEWEVSLEEYRDEDWSIIDLEVIK